MKRKFSPIAAGFTALVFLTCICITACDTAVPQTGKVIVKPHADNDRNDTYCTYDITAVPKGGSLKVGDIICIYCNNQAKCDNYTEVQVAEGIVYTVKARDNGLPCVSCPAKDATPPGHTYEKQ